ncbi:MAG: type II toxin-antitoxin system RelE/ParE family toxin [Methanoregula sp.]
MDFQVVWSPEAIEDMESIAGYISRDSERYAAAVVDRLLNAARDLSYSPYAGRIVPELEDKSIRELIIYSYRLVYRVKGNVITVAAVIHGKRLLDPVTERIRGQQQ